MRSDPEGIYDALTTERVLAIRDRFGATHFVSRIEHPFPVLFRAGEWRVYGLPAGATPRAPTAP